MKYATALLFLLASYTCGWGQQTVGLFTNTASSYDGYTLFAPMTNTTTYLINNCGEKVHSWASTYKPGLSVYLLENGYLLRTRNVGNTHFGAGGVGGGIELLDWDGTLVWEYTLSSDTECQHHDVEYLPNGNILVVVWEAKTEAEAIQAGTTLQTSEIWSEKLVEIKPDLVNGGGTVVWEWKVWDHLVQDNDPNKDHYGTVGEAPQWVNVDYRAGVNSSEDWLHINSVDYNAELDQVMVSVHNLSEIWIIDHSTTTAEAAGHTGGNSGKGGDLLYRWGNPSVYDQGTADDQLLFLQHDAQWIDAAYPDGKKILVFNNQAGSPQNYSEVNVIDPPVDVDGKYTYSGKAYAPTGFHWTYQASTPTEFYAANISGAQRMPNGNTLICEGPSGRFFEVDANGNTVWEYVNPVSNKIIAQEAPATRNSVFRCARYTHDYAALKGRDLTPQGYIETGSTFDCELYASAPQPQLEREVHFYPNPASDQLFIESVQPIRQVVIFDVMGRQVINTQGLQVNVSHLEAGPYLMRIEFSSGETVLGKFIKN